MSDPCLDLDRSGPAGGRRVAAEVTRTAESTG
ncbi:hypothetical protein MELE44368_04445 [Mycolicibacterium elephantis DSM 44368]|uniref:Uncharacterized protein n=1 Tax=Mycolicibacterium elephantis DSM 44368 TaxID=1335622 RepID=A0A439DRW1_9MYCO|nr:hypothetical protein MELE44368_04445 [Mycolicibacterium elephantis DSM 44368]